MENESIVENRHEIGPVLFVAPSDADYLSACLLHGLRGLLGESVIDYPRYDVAYDDYPAADRGKVYGRGFSVFFLLGEPGVDRTDIEIKLARGHFRLVIFAAIQRQFGLFTQWRPWLPPERTILMDGEDSQQVYPFAGRWWRSPYYWFLPRANRGYLYFKREWTPNSQFNLWHRTFPESLRGFLPHYKGLRGTSYSFPAEKILACVPPKSRDFARHIVDPEVARVVAGSSTSYAFGDERDYYADLQAARFSTTTKRSGWDCMRHYEIAANGCVPCFRKLDLKPATCAPHGLRPAENCVLYHSAEELLQITGSMSDDVHHRLAEGALAWARANSTLARAGEVLEAWRRFQSKVNRTTG